MKIEELHTLLKQRKQQKVQQEEAAGSQLRPDGPGTSTNDPDESDEETDIPPTELIDAVFLLDQIACFFGKLEDVRLTKEMREEFMSLADDVTEFLDDWDLHDSPTQDVVDEAAWLDL